MALASAASNSASLIACPRSSTQCARETRDHAVVLGQALAGIGPRVAAGEGDDADHAVVRDQRRVEIRHVRDRQLEHHLAVRRQGIEALVSSSRRMASAAALSGLLIETSGSRIGTRPCLAICSPTSNCCAAMAAMPLLRGQVDDRAHLGAEDAELHRPLEQRVEVRDRLHQADAVLLGLEALVDLQRTARRRAPATGRTARAGPRPRRPSCARTGWRRSPWRR